MKALKVQLIHEPTYQVLETIICKRLDAVSSMTVCSESKTKGTINGTVDLHFPYNIDHWNLIDGIITIYYDNGLIMEVTRIPNL
jgi:hypothetical protein